MTSYSTGEYSGQWMRPAAWPADSHLHIKIVGDQVLLGNPDDDQDGEEDYIIVPATEWDHFRYALIHDQWTPSQPPPADEPAPEGRAS